MKIFTTKKEGRRQIFKIFDITYCVKIANKYHTKYKKFYFKNLIKTFRKFSPLLYTMEHKFFFYNILLFTIKEFDNYRHYYFKNILIKKFHLTSFIINNKLFHQINQYDNAFILNANSGETYLFLMYALDVMLKRYNAQKPVLLATKKYHIEMIKMICPEIPFLYVTNLYQNINKSTFEINGTRFIKIFSTEHFYKVEQEIKADPNAHYYESILETLEINKSEIIPRKIVELDSSNQTLQEKINKINLDINNFVFLSPEAASCEALDDEFWINKIITLKKQGFDIFVNIINNSKIYDELGCKSCYLTYSEAFSLAKKAKKIYSLRSGFTEFLLHTKIPMEVYYSPFKCNDITGEQIKTGFSLLKIPNTDTNNIIEHVIKY